MVAQSPMGPVLAVALTGVTQPWPLHWYHLLSERACTQVRAGTLVPSVADASGPALVGAGRGGWGWGAGGEDVGGPGAAGGVDVDADAHGGEGGVGEVAVVAGAGEEGGVDGGDGGADADVFADGGPGGEQDGDVGVVEGVGGGHGLDPTGVPQWAARVQHLPRHPVDPWPCRPCSVRDDVALVSRSLRSVTFPHRALSPCGSCRSRRVSLAAHPQPVRLAVPADTGRHPHHHNE